MPKGRFPLFLLAMFFMLSLYSWRAKVCFNPDELFYYKASQTVSDFKSLYAPKYYDEHRFQKPPLFYLIVFLFFKFFGINWFSARLATIFASILLLIMTYLLGKKMFDKEKVFFGIATLATSLLFFRFGRIVLPEMTFVFFIAAALYFAYRAFSETKRKFFYLSFLFMGIGTLVKGPLAFLLPALVILAFRIMSKKDALSVRIPWLSGFFIVSGLILLWLAPTILIHKKDFLSHIVTVQLVKRLGENAHFANPWGYVWHHFKKFSFYIPVTFAGYLPWSSLIPVAFLAFHKRLERKAYLPERRFLLIWILTGFLLITIIPSKRFHYVLVFFPSLSLYLVSFFNFKIAAVRKMFWGFLAVSLTGLLLTVIVIFPYIFIDGVDRLSVKLADVLERDDLPVAISWKLDPQEIELYIDRRAVVLQQANLENWGAGVPEFGRSGFYFIVAKDEYDQFVDTAVSAPETSRIVHTKLGEDWRWRKTIMFNDFFTGLLKNPKEIKALFKNAFQEKVFLFAVHKK